MTKKKTKPVVAEVTVVVKKEKVKCDPLTAVKAAKTLAEFKAALLRLDRKVLACSQDQIDEIASRLPR